MTVNTTPDGTLFFSYEMKLTNDIVLFSECLIANFKR